MKRALAKLRSSRTQDDNKFFVAVSILTAVAAMMLCMWIGMQQSIWFDEAYSIVVAKEPVAKLLADVALDTHPPFYYLLLKAWGGVFGWSEFALRSLSILAYGGSIVFAGALIRRMFGSRAAVAVLMFLVLAPMMMRYGFEIRMYALASFIGIAATYTMVRAYTTKRKDSYQFWALYAVLVALGMYTLYYMAFLWIAHLVWLLFMTWRTKSHKNLYKAPWIWSYLGSIVLFLPWLPKFFEQLGNDALAPIGQPMNLDSMLGVLSFNFIYQPIWQLKMAMTAVMLFVVITLAVTVIRAWRMHEHRDYYALLGMYIGVPIVLLMLLSFLRPMYVERYLSHVAIGLMMFVGVSVWLAEKHKPSQGQKLATGMLAVIVLIGFGNLALLGNYNFQRLQKPNLEQVAQQVKGCRNGDAIVAADPYVAVELMANVPNCVVHFYSDTADLKGGYAPLANSPLRVDNPVTDISGAKVIKYVYYGDPKLTFDQNYRSDSRTELGPVTVQTLSVE